MSERRPSAVASGALVALCLPVLVLAVVVGVAERLLGDDGTVAKLAARPFLWAVERYRRSA